MKFLFEDALFDVHESAWRIVPPGAVDAAPGGDGEAVEQALAGPGAAGTGSCGSCATGRGRSAQHTPAAGTKPCALTGAAWAGPAVPPALR
ncbi:hypothetical protein ACIOEW_41010 [Streptomyces sp. NPDC087901]|uniref:hypothetical protein n=1 Tax=Streptomyces sp. NPDC087901 TaxID=3365818 RepID=UPI0038157608